MTPAAGLWVSAQKCTRVRFPQPRNSVTVFTGSIRGLPAGAARLFGERSVKGRTSAGPTGPCPGHWEGVKPPAGEGPGEGPSPWGVKTPRLQAPQLCAHTRSQHAGRLPFESTDSLVQGCGVPGQGACSLDVGFTFGEPRLEEVMISQGRMAASCRDGDGRWQPQMGRVLQAHVPLQCANPAMVLAPEWAIPPSPRQGTAP